MEGKKKVFEGLSTLGSVLVILVLGVFFLAFILYLKPDILRSNETNMDKMETSILDSTAVGEEIVDSIHVETGLVAGEGLQLVIANCTNCHSAKLVTQNRLTKEGWTQVIRWMQETQGLWDLGSSEDQIVAYLAKHYAPQARGRRKALDVEWYSLD